MKIRLFTEFCFDSAHNLQGYDGPCKDIHGHTWHVKIWVQGEEQQLDDRGILLDFAIIRSIEKALDHTYIVPNSPVFYKFDMTQNRANPTAENISTFIYRMLREEMRSDIEYCVRVYEKAVGMKAYAQIGDFHVD